MAGGRLGRFKRSRGQQGHADETNEQEGNGEHTDGSPSRYLNLDQNEEPSGGQPEATNEAQPEATNEAQPDSVRPRTKRGHNSLPTSTSTITKVDDNGESVAPNDVAAQFSTACGCLARDFVPIKYKKWKGRNNDPEVVPEKTKEVCWTKLKELFNFPEGTDMALVRKKALSSMATTFKWMKYDLNKQFVKSNTEPEWEKQYPKQKDFWSRICSTQDI